MTTGTPVDSGGADTSPDRPPQDGRLVEEVQAATTLVVVEQVVIDHLAQGGTGLAAHYHPQQGAYDGAGQTADKAAGWAADDAHLSANAGTLVGGRHPGTNAGGSAHGPANSLGVIAGQNMIRT